MSTQDSSALVRVTIEIPRWSFAKYALTEHGGHVEFYSPLPSPFNYGFVRNEIGGDGMPLDAIVLGPRLKRESEHELPVVATIQFVDNDETDDKLVCSSQALTWWDLILLKGGFRIYVIMKRWVNWSKGKNGSTRYYGIKLNNL